MKSTSRIIICCMILLALNLLTGCGMDSGLQISKVSMEPLDTMDFMICWPEESLRGKKIKRLVDNFNLMEDENLKINLITVSDREEYQEELKILAATNELPDIFILIRNNEDMFLEKSGKLMNLAPYQNDINYEEKNIKNVTGDFYYNELLSVCFEIPTLRFSYLSDMASTYGYQFVSDSTKLLYKLFDNILKSENGVLEIDDYIDSQEGLLFLYYLCNQEKTFDPSKEENWEMVLQLWKRYSKVFGTFKDKYTTDESEINNIQLCNIGNVAFSEQWTNEAGRYKSVILTGEDNQILFGSPLCWAVVKQSNVEKEKIVIRFISDLLEVNWEEVQMMDLPENQFEIYDDTTMNVIESENLKPRQAEKINETLRMLLMETMNYHDCAEIIAELWQ